MNDQGVNKASNLTESPLVHHLYHLCQSGRHLEGPHGVHVGGDDRDPLVGSAGIKEVELSVQVDLQGEKNFLIPQRLIRGTFSFLVILQHPQSLCT